MIYRRNILVVIENIGFGCRAFSVKIEIEREKEIEGESEDGFA